MNRIKRAVDYLGVSKLVVIGFLLVLMLSVFPLGINPGMIYAEMCIRDSRRPAAFLAYRFFLPQPLRRTGRQDNGSGARKAMALINEGDVAALNSGTTNTVLLQELVGLNLRVTVGTNNYAVLSALMQNPAIRLIAVGGGSIMDVGKSLYRLYGKALPDADALRRLIEGKGYGRRSARWSGVPATAGTGSEVTRCV